jgi:ring-1,2-phenylacetyl-CoA epoxidase subunit PaaC
MNPSVTVTGADAVTRYSCRHADRCLVLSHRLQQCITHAPQLEEELALANIALDLLGQARALYSYAASRLGDGLTEDDLAFLRTADEFANPTLVEQPNTDFAAVMVRQLLHDLWALQLWQALTDSPDELLAGVAGKAVKETSYHVRHASEWVVAMGDSTEEAHRRSQSALDALWPHVGGLFVDDPVTAQLAGQGIVPHPAGLRPAWDARVDAVLAEATLTRPNTAATDRRDQPAHSDHFAALVDEMQQLHRSFPGAQW